jgi:hypothetical protein
MHFLELLIINFDNNLTNLLDKTDYFIQDLKLYNVGKLQKIVKFHFFLIRKIIGHLAITTISRSNHFNLIY